MVLVALFGVDGRCLIAGLSGRLACECRRHHHAHQAPHVIHLPQPDAGLLELRHGQTVTHKTPANTQCWTSNCSKHGAPAKHSATQQHWTKHSIGQEHWTKHSLGKAMGKQHWTKLQASAGVASLA